MISKATMKIELLSAMAAGAEDTAINLRLTASMGPGSTQRDVNRLRSFMLSEAGKLRAKIVAIKDAEDLKRRKRVADAAA